jgi:LysM repeat protein
VLPGEDADKVAAKFNMTVPQLLGINQFRDPADVKPGRAVMVAAKPGAVLARTPVPAQSGTLPAKDAARELAGKHGSGANPKSSEKSEQGMKVSEFKSGPSPSIAQPAGATRALRQDAQGVPLLRGQPKDNSGEPRDKVSPAEKGLPSDENIVKFKEIVDDSVWQEVVPNKRQFVQLSRYFVNQISCPGGKFVQALMPQDKYVETELSENGSDFFLRVGNNPDKQFPLDLVLICEDQTYMLNAVVHTGVPSQQIRLRMPKKTKELVSIAKSQPQIAKAQALPMEEQLIRIARRVYKEDYLSYWDEDAAAVSRHKWYSRPFTIVVNNVIKTHINGYVAWDFLVKGYSDGSDEQLQRELQRAVRGKPVAIGKVAGSTVARYIVITQEAEAAEAARKGAK